MRPMPDQATHPNGDGRSPRDQPAPASRGGTLGLVPPPLSTLRFRIALPVVLFFSSWLRAAGPRHPLPRHATPPPWHAFHMPGFDRVPPPSCRPLRALP